MNSSDLSSILRDSDCIVEPRTENHDIREAIRALRNKSHGCPDEHLESEDENNSSSLSYSQQRNKLKSQCYVGTDRSDMKPSSINAVSGGYPPGSEAFRNRSQPDRQGRSDVHNDIIRSHHERPECFESRPFLSLPLQQRLSSVLGRSDLSFSDCVTMSVVDLHRTLETSREFSEKEVNQILVFFEYQKFIR